MRKFFILTVMLYPILSFGQKIYINEFLAINNSINRDNFNRYEDWIELYNPNSYSVLLRGYRLTDDKLAPNKWAFPDNIIIPAKGFLLIWASDRDTVVKSFIHAKFKLSGSGEFIGLSSPSQLYIDSMTFGQQTADISYARKHDGSSTWQFSPTPTPGISNDSLHLVPLQPPIFSRTSGIYSTPISVTLSHPTQNVNIYFTLDGSNPSTASSKYVSAINIESTKVLKAFAASSTRKPSETVSYTFIIQPQGNLPILSLITDPKNLYSADSGIFVYYDSTGSDWERPVTAHYFNRSNNTQFEIDAGVRVHGGSSRSRTKKSLRLYFKSKYGEPKLEYKLFNNSNIKKFDELVIRSGSNDMYQMSSRWSMVRDQLVSDLYSKTRGYYTKGNFAQVYLNGKPHGLYNIREHVSSDFIKDNLGIYDPDLLEDFNAELGDKNEWNILWNFLHANTVLDSEKYKFVEQRLDIDNFIDYQIYEIYAGNEDWPHHNIYWVRDRKGGKWNCILWDVDRAFRTYSHSLWNSLAWALRDTVRTDLYYSDAPYKVPATIVLRRLMTNETFKNKFIARFTDLLNTEFQPINVIRVLDSLKLHLNSDIEFETRAWGSSYQRWMQNLDTIRVNITVKIDSMKKYIRDQFGFSGMKSINVKTPNPARGRIWVNNLLVPVGSWSGEYFKGFKVTISATPSVGYRFVKWTDTTLSSKATFTRTISSTTNLEAIFEPDTSVIAIKANDVIINEYWCSDNGTRYPSIGFKPIEGSWIELLVTKSGGVDLRGWRLTINTTKTKRNPLNPNEGSIVFGSISQLANVPRGTYVLIVTEKKPLNDYHFQDDDLDASDSTLILYIGNRNLILNSDIAFNLPELNHSIALLHPGKTDSYDDDIGVDFIAESSTVTPTSFGITANGVNFTNPFVGIGDDDGAIFANSGIGIFNNDDGIDPTPHDIYPGRGGWIVDPSKEFTGDDPANPKALNILTPGKRNYSLTTNVTGEIIPTEYKLYQNYPNPFNPSTTIKFSIPHSAFVTLKVYDILGREIANLMNEYKSAGSYEVNFETSKYHLASGIYFIRLNAGKFESVIKTMLLK
ncbi:MAG: CotH kinase family protein [Bacteroidetes bacterium]|nr:CotH kinase family protein [Bacteroidota bacterium]MBU2585147.1 CotH kinase family protein [Bacteroidota bacterium]